MFEEYLQDSYDFYIEAKGALDERKARRCCRAAVFHAAGAIEAYVNYVADSFAKAESLSPHEIAFLNDKTIYFKIGKWETLERTEFHKLDEKIKLLFHKFDPNYDFSTAAWSRLMEFKDFRDSLTHPRQIDDDLPVLDYQKQFERGFAGIIQVINDLSKAVYNKPLRKKLLDLIPE